MCVCVSMCVCVCRQKDIPLDAESADTVLMLLPSVFIVHIQTPPMQATGDGAPCWEKPA